MKLIRLWKDTVRSHNKWNGNLIIEIKINGRRPRRSQIKKEILGNGIQDRPQYPKTENGEPSDM